MSTIINANAGTIISKMKESFSDLTKKECKEILDFVLNEITTTLVSGGRASFAGFGAFEVAARKERNGRNPKTQELMVIPAKNKPVFRPFSDFKKLVNK
jgi:nucleoid DNA-binding protein